MGYSFNIFRLIISPCCSPKKKTNPKKEVYTNGAPPKCYVQPDDEEKPEVDNEVTWVDVAKALDWLAFIITTFFNFGTTALFGWIMLLGSARDQPSIEREVVTNITDFYYQGYDDHWAPCNNCTTCY